MALDPFFRDSHIFHRSFSRKPLAVVSQTGLILTLDDGRTILDATGGPAVACLGHNVPEVTQYWHTRGQPQRTRFIARRQSYHGNTLGALAVSGHEGRRQMYHHWLPGNVSFVDACCSYRGRLDANVTCSKRSTSSTGSQLLRSRTFSSVPLGRQQLPGTILHVIGATRPCSTCSITRHVRFPPACFAPLHYIPPISSTSHETMSLMLTTGKIMMRTLSKARQ